MGVEIFFIYFVVIDFSQNLVTTLVRKITVPVDTAQWRAIIDILFID